MDRLSYSGHQLFLFQYSVKRHRIKSSTIVVIMVILCIMANLQCSASQGTSRIRLVNGAAPNEGRVEMDLDDGRGWGTVCDIGWDYSDAAVVCKQIGYPAATYSTQGARYGGNPALPVLLENVACKPFHISIEDCPAAEASAACDHTNDGGVKCMIPGFLGCFSLQSGGSRAWTITENSNDECISHCKTRGYRYAGMSGTICRCGSTSQRYFYAQLPDYFCNANCVGDPTQLCGHPVNGYYSGFDTTLGICEDPGIPQNGNRSGNNFAFGSTVTYTCDDDYVIRGNSKLQCILGNSPHEVKWSGRPPTCDQSPNSFLPTTPTIPGTVNWTIDDVTMEPMTSSEGSSTLMSKQTISSGAIAGTTVAMVLVIVATIVLICVYVVIKKRARKQNATDFQPETLSKKSDSIENIYGIDEPNMTENETRMAPSLVNYDTVEMMNGNGHISRTLPSIHLYMDVTVPNEERISPTSDYGTVFNVDDNDNDVQTVRTPGDGIEGTDQPDSEQRVYFVLEDRAPKTNGKSKNQPPEKKNKANAPAVMGRFVKKGPRNGPNNLKSVQNITNTPNSSHTITEYSSTSVVNPSEDVNHVEGATTENYVNSEFHEVPKNLIDNVLYTPTSVKSKEKFGDDVPIAKSRTRNSSDSDAPRKSQHYRAAPDSRRRRSTGEPKRSRKDIASEASLMSACYVNTEFHAVPDNMIDNELYKPCTPGQVDG